MRTSNGLRINPRHDHFAFSLLILAVSTNPASAGEPVEGRALVIGIQQYTTASRLPGVANDVRVLADTLEERGGYSVQTVVDSAKGDSSAMFGNQSERDSLQKAIGDWLAERKQDESALLYFSGHGFRDEEERLYLAAVDCDPKDPKPGGIPIAWLREQLVKCPAGAKLLILDACHAGNARSVEAKNLATAKQLGEFFEKTEGLVTLASCTGEQQSYMWPKKKQSIFTYWLAQGLCGHADREPLGEITLNELDDYVTRKVARTAKTLHSLDQTPTRLQGPDVTQSEVMRLRPGSLKQSLDDMAEQMDVLIRLNNLQRVGIVPQFASGPTGDVLSDEFGNLARYCPVELGNRLASKGEGDYTVMSTNAVRELLQSKGIVPKDLGTSKCRGIQIEGRSLTTLVAGQVSSLKSGVISLRCQLLDLTNGDIYGIAGGMAAVCGSETAMQGVSGPAEPVVTADDDGGATIPPELEQVEIDSSAGHPLRDPSFPYRARIKVKQANGKMQERSGTFRGNDCFVTFRRGEIFHVYMANRSDTPVFARVLVDGLNTLPEKSQTKGIDVEPVVVDQWQQAQPVNLAEARAWGPLDPGKEYAIKGFYLKTGANAVLDEFKLVDATQSLAAEAGYSTQLGLITVAFYELKKKPPPPPPGSRDVLGIGRGARYRTQTETYRGDHVPGRLLAVVHIRYGE